MTVRLRPLREDEVRGFIDGLGREYVRGLIEDASLTREEAEEKAANDHASLFPGGRPQADHHMYVLETETGEAVGYLFWARREAEVKTRTTGFLDSLIYLHMMPGPHRHGESDWFFLRLWRWLADRIVSAVLLLSLTGSYMWALLKAERRVGLVLLGAGCLSLMILVGGFFLV